MVTRALSLLGAGLEVDLDSPEFAALQGGSGFAFVEATPQWFEGAGDGATYLGSRDGRRIIPLPVLVTGRDADELQERMSRLAIILDKRNAPATLRLNQGQEAWTTPVVRSGSAHPVYGTDTNGSTWALLNLVLESGDTTWRRERAELTPIRAGGLGRGLLGQSDTPPVPPGSSELAGSGAFGERAFGEGTFGGRDTTGAPEPPPPGGTGNSLTRLRLSSGQAMGPAEFDNPGDATTRPLVVVTGPATSMLSVSPTGETLAWAGTLQPREFLYIDHATRTITDAAGRDRYTELGPAPLFWEIPPGRSTAYITLEGVTRDSGVDLVWHPRAQVRI